MTLHKVGKRNAISARRDSLQSVCFPISCKVRSQRRSSRGRTMARKKATKQPSKSDGKPVAKQTEHANAEEASLGFSGAPAGSSNEAAADGNTPTTGAEPHSGEEGPTAPLGPAVVGIGPPARTPA